MQRLHLITPLRVVALPEGERVDALLERYGRLKVGRYIHGTLEVPLGYTARHLAADLSLVVSPGEVAVIYDEDELELHAFLLLGPDRVEEVKLAAVRRGEVVRVVG
ncbi:hypothetical protein [Thermus sp. NEB1569]|uniref:hypothetical protein n=1 Tax=Thermus sp. NEB1569 TaxID=2918899 RepID=UPI001EFBF330|nr:hypothetical protein [Thermus sp. NEB1569]ULR39693.1 hypothetical protein MI302_00355 [Thermus sp. NEB1569]